MAGCAAMVERVRPPNRPWFCRCERVRCLLHASLCLQVEALCRAPEIDELAAREQAPVAAAGSGTAFPGPEAWW